MNVVEAEQAERVAPVHVPFAVQGILARSILPIYSLIEAEHTPDLIEVERGEIMEMDDVESSKDGDHHMNPELAPEPGMDKYRF